MKTYLVIGAGPGIALATAERFARDGFRIVLAARSGRSIASGVEALRAAGATVEVDTIDAADPQAVAALVRRHAQDLAVLHYNAGVLHYDAAGALQPRTLAQETVDSLDSDLRTNLTSALAAVQAAQAVMAARGEGSILLTGGGFGVEPTPAFINISVAKAGLRAAARALFEPAREQGIHVATVTVSTLVAPGSDKAKEVADAFRALHAQPHGEWTWEAVVA